MWALGSPVAVPQMADEPASDLGHTPLAVALALRVKSGQL